MCDGRPRGPRETRPTERCGSVVSRQAALSRPRRSGSAGPFSSRAGSILTGFLGLAAGQALPFGVAAAGALGLAGGGEGVAAGLGRGARQLGLVRRGLNGSGDSSCGRRPSS